MTIERERRERDRHGHLRRLVWAGREIGDGLVPDGLTRGGFWFTLRSA